MIKLYLARHGETVWNTEHRFQGRMDSNLTDLGKTQSKLLNKRIKEINPDIIFTSPSGRTKQTIKIATQDLNINILEDERLYEMNFGKWEGLHFDELSETDLKLSRHLFDRPSLYVPKTGESFKDVMERSKSFFDFLFKNYDNKTVFVMTHGMTRLVMTAYLTDVDLDTFRDEGHTVGKQTSVTYIEMNKDGKNKLLYENDDSHLID